MKNNGPNVVSGPWADNTGNTGGGGGSMEARLARLEAHVEHIQTDLSEIKQDLRDFRTDMRSLLGALIFVALGLAGIMAKGFGWL